MVSFGEQFQINTVMDLDKHSGGPVKEKQSKFTARIEKDGHDVEIAEVDFNMNQAEFDKEKPIKLYLRQSAFNKSHDIDERNTFLDITIKATKIDGLIQQRMSTI